MLGKKKSFIIIRLLNLMMKKLFRVSKFRLNYRICNWGIMTMLYCFCFELQIVVPPLPSKALKRQLPFRSDDGIYEETFIEERRSNLEAFVNK
jgi:hypothetical protein